MAFGTSDYKKISFVSKPDLAGNFDIANVEKDIRSIVNNAVKSSLPPNAYFRVGEKQLMPNGQTRVDVYIHESSASLTETSMRQQANAMHFKGSSMAKYDVISPVDVDRETARALAKDERAKQRLEGEEKRHTRGTLLKIVAIITTLADITRRILSSVLTFSQQTTQDMITAHNLGMSYEAVRGYRHTETAHGMKEGTITGAISDIQAKFGNITMLDEKALETLAVVMGGKIEEMATMGLGASNPEKVLGAILDTFNEKANAGYNSVGQYVGEQQARRELYSYLLKVSPQIADIFATMQEEQHNINSLYRNQADTFENWKNLVPTSRGGNGWGQYGVVEVTGQQWNVVKDMLKQIKEGILVSLAPAVFTLLQRIANSRLFMTESEKRKLNEENRAKNQAELNAINKTLSIYDDNYDNLSVGEKAYYDVLVEQRNALKKELGKDTIDDITTVPAILESRAEKKIRESGKVIYREGEKIPIIADLGYDELKDVIDAYNFDTPKKRKEYEEYIKKEAKNAGKAVDNAMEADKEKLEKEARDKINDTKGFNEARKSGVLKKAYKSLNSKEKENLKALYNLGEIYNFAYDLENEEGRNYAEKVVSALKRASSEGLGTFQGGKFYISSDKYVEEGLNKLWSMSSLRASGEVPVDYGLEYLKWLYTNDANDRAEMNEHILAYRADQIIEGMQKGDLAISAWEWLHETEGTEQDWRKYLEGLPTGTYNIRGENTNPEYGENVYRIVVDVKENGRLIGTKEVFSAEGAFGYEKSLGTVTVDSSSGKTNYITDLGTPASKRK